MTTLGGKLASEDDRRWILRHDSSLRHIDAPATGAYKPQFGVGLYALREALNMDMRVGPHPARHEWTEPRVNASWFELESDLLRHGAQRLQAPRRLTWARTELVAGEAWRAWASGRSKRARFEDDRLAPQLMLAAWCSVEVLKRFPDGRLCFGAAVADLFDVTSGRSVARLWAADKVYAAAHALEAAERAAAVFRLPTAAPSKLAVWRHDGRGWLDPFATVLTLPHEDMDPTRALTGWPWLRASLRVHTVSWIQAPRHALDTYEAALRLGASREAAAAGLRLDLGEDPSRIASPGL